MQAGFACYLAQPEHYLQLAALYQAKRDRLATLLQASPFRLLPASGSFFMLASFRDFSDESDSGVYEHILFDGRQHCGMATHPELAQRSVIVSSFGKTFHVTGWRVGYALAPAAIMAEIVKIHQFMMYAVTPVGIKLQQPDFAINWDEVRARLSPRTRMIIINTPHNPTGQVLTPADLSALAQLTRNTDIIVLSDGLKNALAEKVRTLYGQHYDADSEVLITGSASQGLYMAISALVHAGDEVIFFEPAFDSYAPVVRLQGGVSLCSKQPDVGTTIFSVIGQLSARHQAINLSQGAPNFPCDPLLVELVAQAMHDGQNQYAPMTGLPGPSPETR
ncbi:hypothetical protein CRX72_18010 [Pantoea sp. BRM17]|nr:hypothetical protein CRX72_18010 [Pantoea sp. BRM17]